MQSDLRLAVVSLYCLCSLGIIGSFAIFRFSIGDWLIGIVDLLIVAVFLSLAILAWSPRWTRLAANLTATAASLAGLTVVLALDLSYMWLFATLVGNFLMADRRVALILSAVVVVIIGLRPDTFIDTTEHATFVAVATMVSLLSAIFATRVDSQHGQLTELASRDGLTGAFNRRALDRDLLILASAAGRDRREHCLAIMDLDNFKQLNDQYGHEAGDNVLISLTDIITTATRSSDRFYRYGGEEFVLLLPDTSLAGARIALGKLRACLSEELTGPSGQVTASYGLAVLHPSELVETWLGRADQALLTAKQKGKDCIVEA